MAVAQRLAVRTCVVDTFATAAAAVVVAAAVVSRILRQQSAPQPQTEPLACCAAVEQLPHQLSQGAMLSLQLWVSTARPAEVGLGRQLAVVADEGADRKHQPRP